MPKKPQRRPSTRADGFKVPQLPKAPPRGKQGGFARATRQLGKCGAKKKSGGTCSMPRGWGTNHYGIGKCKFHGGATPNHVKAAARAEYRLLLGTPIEINPLDALIMCIKIRAGEIKWLSDRMSELDEKSWIEDTMVGKQFHLYARERAAAMQDLARYSGQAISLGIAERAIKLAETYGEMLAALIQGILGDLELNPAQRAKAPQIIRRHLIALDGGSAVQPGDMLALESGA